MTPEAKVAAVLRSLVRDGLEEMFGDGARIELPDGERDAESFAIVRPSGQNGDVEVITITVSRL